MVEHDIVTFIEGVTVLSLTLHFLKLFINPAFVDESITAEVEVLEIRKSIMKCSTTAIRTKNKEVRNIHCYFKPSESRNYTLDNG